ncbi:MAG: hypothetical protein U5R31_14600 [Acidimicrobiia bacterium]|nr:hypothetical protein [Acidimicrobiia bacterium]
MTRPSLRRRHELAATGGRGRRGGGGRGQCLRDPTDRLEELTGLDRRRQDVAHPHPQRLLQQLGGELGGDEDRPHLPVLDQQPLDHLQGLLVLIGGPEHHHDRAARESGAAVLDRRERRRALAELHREPAAGRLVRVDDRDRDVGASAGGVAGAREGTGHSSVSPSGP